MVGAGKAEGAIDAGNMLKPALARGELHCIGATTLDEYRKYLEKDAALERRFQKILVGEPSVEATIAILRGLQEKYEVHHGVEITDPAIVAAAELSHRYITDRFLPDKAIDLIDEAASKVKIEIDSKPEAIDKLDRRLIQLQIERASVLKEKDEASKRRRELIEEEIKRVQKELADLDEIWKAEKAAAQGSAQLLEEIDKTRFQIEELKRKGNYDKVAELQYGTLPELERKLKEAQAKEQEERRQGPAAIAADDGRRRGDCRGGGARHWNSGLQADAGGARQAAADGSPAARARRRPGRGDWRCRQRDSPLALGPFRPEPANRLIPVSRPHRCRQDRAVQGAGRVPVRQRGSPNPPRHERVHGEALGGPHDRRAARLRRLRRRRLPDRGRSPQALQRAAAGRGGKSAPGRLQRPAPGARRRPSHRWPGPHGRLQEHRDRHDL